MVLVEKDVFLYCISCRVCLCSKCMKISANKPVNDLELGRASQEEFKDFSSVKSLSDRRPDRRPGRRLDKRPSMEIIKKKAS